MNAVIEERLGKSARNILVISPVPTHPLIAGNRARIAALLESLQGLGHRVQFVHVRQEVGDDVEMREKWGDIYQSVSYQAPSPSSLFQRITIKLKRLFRLSSRFSFPIDAWYDSSIEERLVQLTRDQNIDTVIVEYVWFSKILEALDKRILKIIDAHDKFSDRHLHYLRRNKTPTWFSTSARGESTGFDRADVVMAIQDDEQIIFANMTRAKVRTVGHVVPVTRPKSQLETEAYILFVASVNSINLQGINWFLEEVYPAVRQKHPQIELKIAGSVSEKLGTHDGVVKLGRVENLQRLYERASVVVNPVSIYTGLSIKNLEALSFSKPLVTKLSENAVGVDKHRRAFRAVVTANQFSDAVIKILDEPEEYSILSQAAYEYAMDWNRNARIQLEEVLGTQIVPNLVKPN